MDSPHRIRDHTVLVTGGCGFIGSHLVRRLAQLGAARIVIVDSLRYGDAANLGASASAVEIVRHTLGEDEPTALDEAMRGVDFVFHLAAEKHNQSRDDPLRVLRSNVEGTHHLLEAAARCGVRKVVFTSSLYAYGRTQGAPYDEGEVPQPTTVYGISKLAGEHLLAHFQAERGLRGNSLRLLFVYGPRQFAGAGYKSVIVKTFERLLSGEAPVVVGDGRQALDYVYVDDAIDALVAALECGASGEVLNVASGTPTAVRDLIGLMQKVAGTSLPIRSAPADWTAGSLRVGRAEKARNLLGWQPRTSLREGLAETFSWMATRVSALDTD